MDYYPAKTSLQEVFNRLIPLSSSQTRRLCQFSQALLLAGNPHLSKIARQLEKPIKQASRIQWIRRLLDAPFLEADYVYSPFIKTLLTSYNSGVFHLLIDRTDLTDHQYDLLAINLHFHRRSIPIAWELIPNGMTGAVQQKALINRCVPLLPQNKPIVFHGDNEFGSVAVMKHVAQLGWDFILAQASKNAYKTAPETDFRPLGTLAVTPSQAVYCSNLILTRTHAYTPVNLFAFYHPVYHRNRRKQDNRYYATSLPISPNLRRIGKRRWGIECYFKDLKSAGWQLPFSQIQHPKRFSALITMLNWAYTWTTALGRWLSKTSQRHLVDDCTLPKLSLFRVGWDWLVHQLRTNQLTPVLTTLYR